MFLKQILSRNPALIDVCVALHQRGEIPANSYVLDIDTIRRNAAILAGEGKKHGLRVLPMTKQIGRNPAALDALKKEGLDACVCVDMDDAHAVHAAGLKVGHLGHLVQTPAGQIAAAAAMNPGYWTVYSLEQARAISGSLPPGKTQNIMLRIFREGDIFYKGHEGGFEAGDVLAIIEKIEAMPGLRFAGLTTFPARLFNFETKKVEATPNFKTLIKTADTVRRHIKRPIEINAPGTTSSALFKELAEAGVTQVEPGHGFTGSCPQHAFADLSPEAVEEPALVYISEVSHLYKGKAYCFGGGLYIDPVFGNYDVKACVGGDPRRAREQRVSCDIPAPEAIDYYGILQTSASDNVAIGDTVVFGFRAQIFVTRSYVVPVEGIRGGNPKVCGVYFANGGKAVYP
jgi:predicted amino acid racemase